MRELKDLSEQQKIYLKALQDTKKANEDYRKKNSLSEIIKKGKKAFEGRK